MHKILFTGNTFSDKKIAELQLQGIEIIKAKHDYSEDALITALNGVEGYILGGAEIATRKVIESAKELKIIAFFGVGFEKYVDIHAATEKNIVVTNTPAANALTVAEYTVGLILDAVKKLTTTNNATKVGKWDKPQVSNLHDRTLGIIGMGHIGSIVARIMHDGFGMHIVYVSKNDNPQIEADLKAKKVSLHELLERSDVVSIHALLSEETKGMLSIEQLSLMKPTAVLINCARAEIVDGNALYKALVTGKLTSAAFDVYYKEPVPKPDDDIYKLMSLSNDKFLLTSHNASNSPDAIIAMENMVIESISDFFAGENPRHEVVL